MSLFAQLEERLKRALLDRDTETVDVLKLVKSAVVLQAKEQRLASPSDELSQAAIYKQIKAYQEVIDLYSDQNQEEMADEKEAGDENPPSLTAHPIRPVGAGGYYKSRWLARLEWSWR